MSRDITPFGLRMPEPLKSKIKAAADRERRSMNSQIVLILEAWIDTHSGRTADTKRQPKGENHD